MKKIYIIFILLAATPFMSFAQTAKTKKADRHYDRYQYVDAAEAYKKLITRGESDSYIYTRLANSYYYINDSKNAETYYRQVVDEENVDPETVFNYAQTLKTNGKLSEYNAYMKRFAQLKPSDSRAKEFMKNPDYLPKIIDDKSSAFSVSNLEDLNSAYSDFGGRVYGNSLYFTSARNTRRQNYSWNNEPYLDIYVAEIIGGEEKNEELLKGNVNTKYHESTVAISPDGKRMYFDRNDFYKGKYQKDEEGINQLNIYYAENVEGKWTNITPVPFNDTEYSNSHPALSPDGKTLYFTSDRPGGKGQADIYKVSIGEDGSFGNPENLGDINTEGKEGFPFVDSEGTLYFSSDGHLGMGGLDVFYAEAKGNGFGEVKNIGAPVNSPYDDFAIYYNPETKQGYVSSNRPGGKGSDDIYKIIKEEVCELIVNAKVVHAETGEPIAGARLDLYDNRDNKLKSGTTDTQGNHKLSAACDQAHVLQAFKEGFETNAETIAAVSRKGEKNVTIRLNPIDVIVKEDRIVLNPILFDFDKSNIKPQAATELDKLVQVMKNYPSMIIEVESHTDSRGSAEYNLQLSERRAQSTVQYVISKGISKDRISGKGFGKSKPVEDCGSNCTEQQHQTNRRSEFIIVKK